MADQASLVSLSFISTLIQQIQQQGQSGLLHLETPDGHPAFFAFQQGRIVHDPEGSGKSEHALHHFHGLVLDAYSQVNA